MTSSRPYLLRAIYEWIVDNGMTPYLLVNAELDGVEVPVQYVNSGKIILNVAPEAVQGLDISGEDVSFSARFDGKPMRVSFPMSAALAIYARENVAHTWLVDPVAGTLEVLELESGRWSILATHLGHETVRAVPFAEIELPLPALWPEP